MALNRSFDTVRKTMSEVSSLEDCREKASPSVTVFGLSKKLQYALSCFGSSGSSELSQSDRSSSLQTIEAFRAPKSRILDVLLNYSLSLFSFFFPSQMTTRVRVSREEPRKAIVLADNTWQCSACPRTFQEVTVSADPPILRTVLCDD